MNKKQKNLNNKGFSLVELIIVIAIMAVLIGVLAPTYMQYVEKSKKSNDVSTVDSIMNACEVLAVDPEAKWPASNTVTITVGSSLSTGVTDDANVNFNKMFTAIVPTSTKLKATWFSGAGATNQIQVQATKGTNGQVTFKVTAEVLDYSSALAARATDL